MLSHFFVYSVRHEVTPAKLALPLFHPSFFDICIFLHPPLLLLDLLPHFGDHLLQQYLALFLRLGIGVECKARIGMTEDARQRLGVHAAGQRVSGEGVAQIVESNIWQSRVLEDILQPMVSTLISIPKYCSSR